MLVHVLDGGVDPGQPWKSGSAARDYLSASIFNRAKIPHGLYSGGPVLVLAPSSRLRCSYPQGMRSSKALDLTALRHPYSICHVPMARSCDPAAQGPAIHTPHRPVLCQLFMWHADSGTASWNYYKAASDPRTGRRLPGCGPRICSPADAPFASPRHDRGYDCAFPPEMLKDMLEVFDAYPTDVSAYTEVVIEVGEGRHAIVAVIGSSDVHRSLLQHFGLNSAQLPLLRWGPGLKGPGPLFAA